MDDPQGKNSQATQQYQRGKKKIAPSLPAATLKMYILIHQLLLFKNIHYSEMGNSTFTFCNVRMGYFDFNTFGLLLK